MKSTLQSARARAAAAAAAAHDVAARVSGHVPLLLDLVEDRVRSRALTLALFALVLSFVFRAGLYVVFIGAPLEVPSAPQLFLVSEPPQSASPLELGSVLRPPLTARVVDARGLPVAGVRVTASVVLDSADSLVWQRAYALADTQLDATGLS
jgi:hypothetical protein